MILAQIFSGKKILPLAALVFFLFLLWLFQDVFLTRLGSDAYQDTYKHWYQWYELNVPTKKQVELENKYFEDERAGVDLRRTNDAGGNLLLRYVGTPNVYSFNPETKEVQLVTETEWEQATGEIASCQRWGPLPYERSPSRSEKSQRSGSPAKLADGIQSYGSYREKIRNSVNLDKQAILSAYGPRGLPGLGIGLPGLGGSTESNVYGSRYVQIVDLKTNTQIRRPVRLGSPPFQYPIYDLCWTADAEFVVALEYLLIGSNLVRSFSIIDARFSN